MKNFFERKWCLFAAVVVINLILPILVFATIREVYLGTYFNSDTLYLASIYKDIFIDGTGFKGWNLNGAPNFFPDMFLYFIIRPFFSDFKIAYVVFSIVQYNIILFLMGNLFKMINSKRDYLVSILFYLLFPLFLLATIWHHSFQYTFHLFSQSYHNGCFINVLIALNLLFLFLRSEKKYILVLLALISLVGSFNDRLFLVIYSAPIMVVWILNFFRIRFKPLIYSGIVVSLSSLIGVIVFNVTKWNSYYQCIGLGNKFMNFKNALPSLKLFFNQHLDFVQRMDVRGLITIFLLTSIILMLIWLFREFRKSNWLRDTASININTFLFILIITISVVATLLTPIINGYYVGTACIRYVTFAHFIGVFNLVFILANMRVFKKRVIYSLLTIMFILNVGTIAYTFATIPVAQNVKKVTEYYPEKVANLDAFAKANNLTYGVANYWDAKLSTMFSKQNIRVYTVINSKLNLWFHVTNSNWYFDYDKGEFNKPVFEFVISDESDFKETRKLFGEPLDSAVFGKSDWIYQIPKFKYDRKTRQPYVLKQD